MDGVLTIHLFQTEVLVIQNSLYNLIRLLWLGMEVLSVRELMAYYSIGEVAERCGINPVTLRAWQRRYGLLKPQRSEGGHRQFDDEDILRIEEIKRLMKSGVSVGKVKALLENKEVMTQGNWAAFQEEMMTVCAMPARQNCAQKLASFAAITPWMR
ncbi:HTH-type transcriptional repressor YcgE [Enterobacter cloacae]|uniref:HTH-type transcriptional repressor YcgE n=1 Tax=Enterobacter cloacae TaxID=550 RepID=A0A377M2W6_ENTCL|nr:HTH-type transcriptional repressor YcgE [Enterobacter cloacae]